MGSERLRYLMDELSDDVLIEILSRVPASVLAQLKKSTNKRWNALISKPYFIRYHLLRRNQSSMVLRVGSQIKLFDVACNSYSNSNSQGLEILSTRDCPLHLPLPRYVHVQGYCHGLICFCSKDIIDAYLWNPSTDECRKLPEVADRKGKDDPTIYGFGYDTESDDYKVARVSWVTNHRNPVAHIFSLKTNSWKRIRRLVPFNFTFTQPGGTVYLNGAIHWLIYHWKTPQSIISLSLGEEPEFWETPLPEEILLGLYPSLTIFDGCLCVCSCRHRELRFQAWVMREYGENKSWSELIDIPTVELQLCPNRNPLIMELLPLRNGELLLTADYFMGEKKTLRLENHFKEIKSCCLFDEKGREDSYFRYIVCEDSLISPYYGNVFH